MMSMPLPPVAHELARIVGELRAVRLCRHFGGRRLYVPMAGNMGPQHPIALCVGLDAASELAAELGGDFLDIPKLSLHEARSRHREVLRDLNRMSRQAAALKHGLSVRQVRNIIRSSNHG